MTESKNKPYKLNILSDLVAYKLYVSHVEDDSRIRYDVEAIQKLFTKSVSRNLLFSALEVLRGKEIIIRASDRKLATKTIYEYRISTVGIYYVEIELQRRDSPMSAYAQKGDEALDEIAGVNGTFLTPDEEVRSDLWIPLDLDRENKAYQDVVDNLENTLDVIRSDNGFAVEMPETRAGLLASLSEGLRWLKERSPSRADIYNLVLRPLRAVANIFGKSAAAEVVNHTIKLINDWLP